MRRSKFTHCWKYLESSTLIFALASVMGAVVTPIAASAQDKKDEIAFDLVPNPQFVDCLRKSSLQEPKVRATVIRGKLNDTLILDPDGFEPGLPFDLSTVQRSPFPSDKTPIRTSRTSSKAASVLRGINRISRLASTPMTATFASRRSCSTNLRLRSGHVPATTQFNGEHEAGTFAKISGPDQATHLEPLCTDPGPFTCR